MAGDSRVRHCEACARDVVNTAAMTPGQIEAMIAGASLPCLRLVRLEDGSLLTAREEKSGLGRVSAMAASALVAVSSLAAAAQSKQITMCRVPVAHVIAVGQVRGPDGKPLGTAVEVMLTRLSVDGATERSEMVKTDVHGMFRAEMWPGSYSLSVHGPAYYGSEKVDLKAGETNIPTLKLARVQMFMGVPPPPPPPQEKSKSTP